MTSETLWWPTAERVERANISHFAEHVRKAVGVPIGPDYEDLWRWSISDLGAFWREVWRFHGVTEIFGECGPALTRDAMPGAEWFPDARLNFAEFLVGRGAPETPAIIGVTEAGRQSTLTWADLGTQVRAVAASLRKWGIVPGDVVAAYVPNIPEAIVAFLATSWLGATWASVGQDLAARAVVDRFVQLRPKVLFTAEGYRFGGRVHGRSADIEEIRRGLDMLERVVVIPTGIDVTPSCPNSEGWAELLSESDPVDAHRVAFDHPLWVLFSSGTTGIPKGLIHGHGGILLEMLKQMSLHWDLGPQDRVFWFTSPSWVMWNLQLSTLCLGGSIVCYDGSPTWPDARRLWQLAADEGVTFLGFSPGYLQASDTLGIVPREEFDLSALRALGSTGSPLSPYLHRWAFDRVGEVPLWSMSGGTDIAGAFAGGAPTVPITPGELPVRCLGVALEAWDEAGEPIVDGVGELVVRRPMPSMPVALWNDTDGAKYRAAYFDVYPNAWRQGDWVTVTGHGSLVIHGRSDSTLNRNGVRMGSADIYAALDQIPAIRESLVLGIEEPDGEYWMPLFVVLANGAELTPELVAEIATAIRTSTSPRHVPDVVLEVAAIPHTRTGKKLEIPLKRIFQGHAVERVINPDVIDDFDAVREFIAIAEARRAESERQHLDG